MRKLLNTLFVLTENSYLSLDGENVVISVEREEAARFPPAHPGGDLVLRLRRGFPSPDGRLR